MFGKKKEVSTIDKDQLELIENAQKRIRQKRRLYIHFVFFLLGSIVLIIMNTVLGIGENIALSGINWFVFVILIWTFLLVYHAVNVFVITTFLGKDWEKQQLDKLVNQQEQRISKLKQQFLKEEIEIAKSQANKESQDIKRSEQKKKSELTLIVAAGEHNAIGKDNKLIWHLSDDLKRFKSLTNGHHIIMGRKTFESFPRPLPNRTHIVITRQPDYKVPLGVIVVNTMDDALDAARNDKHAFIIGGGEIYKQAMEFIDKIEITRVHHHFKDADAFFPEIDLSVWKETYSKFHDKDDRHEYPFTFLTYERR